MDPKQKEERVHDVFEKIHDNYDSMNSIISFQRHIAWRKDVMQKMNVKKGAAALDVCCGTGDWTIAMADAVGEIGSAIGLDFSKNMLSNAIVKKDTLQMKQLEFVHGNAMELPYPDESFDYVTIGFGLRNVPDYMTVLKELYRVVKKDGIVVCLETSQPKLPVFRQLYYFYFKFIMPIFGKLFAKSYKEYAWLHESAKDFPDKGTLKKMFLEAGFSKIEIKSYTLGVAAMHMGFKQ